MICAKFDWNWPSGTGEEDFSTIVNVFRYFLIISPWKRARPFIWTNHPKMICAKFGWNWPSSSIEEDFFNLSMYFRNFRVISPWKRAGPLVGMNLNSLHPRRLCAKFGWKWPSGSGEEDENVKCDNDDDNDDDNDGQQPNFYRESSREPSTQVC